MNGVELTPNVPCSLVRVGQAWRNRQRLASRLPTFVVVVVLAALGMRGGPGLAVLMILIAMLGASAGFSAAGIQFMDQATARPVTPVLAAFIGSPMVLPRSLGLAVVFFVAFIAHVAVVAIVLLVCKIPAPGARLYAVALPVLALLGASNFLGLTVAGLVRGAALWDGHRPRTAPSQGWAVATQRPLQAFLSLVLLFIVTSVVTAVVWAFVFAGFGVVGGLCAAILGNPMAGGVQGVMGSDHGRPSPASAKAAARRAVPVAAAWCSPDPSAPRSCSPSCRRCSPRCSCRGSRRAT
jgi:hypothetical protein